ncbi:carboxymuconolactone decarboxylase family protein [Novosphingobium sp.]|uniref:carboxymuconolactone decarboxylase family protein n=1 Tax=Novosphingobium sp. TaxID=1874826 RepID=UPI00286DD887|nr:carboxymuconolactone decarboxylase family protein [Novosphingobium sp.]
MTKTPRFPPLEPKDWAQEVHTALERWQPAMKFHKTMAHNPQTLREWIGFGNHILFDNLLSQREREIAILRLAANRQCQYEWGAHYRFTVAEGLMTVGDARALAFPIKAADWSAHEAALISAVDDLCASGEIADPVWSVLAQTYSAAHFIDLIYLVGEFMMVAMFMQSFRIELEDGFEPIPTEQI